MKKTVTLVAALVLAIGLPFGQVAVGQDFGQLLDAVAKLEASLKRLVEAEAAQHTQDVSKLQQEIAQLKEGSPGAPGSATLSKLQTEVAALRKEVADMSSAGTTAGVDEQPADGGLDVWRDIEFLKAENSYLRSLQDKNAKQLASLEGDWEGAGSGPPHAKPLPSQENIEDITTGLEIFGFLDAVANHQRSSDDETDFGLGQAEVNLEKAISERVGVEVAIAYVNEQALFELGATIIDIHLFGGGGGDHLRPAMAVDHSSIIAGLFDVPFGIDYQVYASPDRKLITVPPVVSLTHDEWNDLGFQFTMVSPYGNFVFYGVNGFESSMEVIDQAQALALGVEVGEEIDTSPANAFGTRLGILPISSLEFGVSFAIGFNESGKDEMTLLGADLQYSFFDFELKGEYIYHSLNRSIAKENNRGYYFQATYGLLEKAFLTCRYGSFKPYEADWVGQLSVGTGYTIVDGVEVRFETVLNEDTNDNTNILQLVAGF